MAKKTKKKLTLDEVRELSARKSSKKTDNEDVQSFEDIEHYEDVYDDEDSDYITGTEDGI